MSIEPEEAQAIAEAFREERPAASVAPRNFAEPRRFSSERLTRLGRAVSAALVPVTRALEVPFRRACKLSLAAMREVNVATSLEGLEEPFAVLGLTVGARPAWLVWELPAAVALVETILAGSPGEPGAARLLSPAERRLLESTLARVVRPIVEVLGASAEAPRFVQQRDELTGLESGSDPDLQRLCVHLAFDGPGGASELRLYVPGVRPSPGEAGERAPAVPPPHLDDVALELRVLLGSADVPLSDLLQLEAGDVIPLGVDRGGSVRVCVEDRTCATATLGRSGGRLAVRIEALGAHEEDVEPTPDRSPWEPS